MLQQTDVATVTIVKTASWKSDGFVCRYGFFLYDADVKVREKVQFDPDNKQYYEASRKGSTSKYWEGLDDPLKYSRYLRLSLVAALAAPLGAYLGREGGVNFNISEESSRGKTLALRLNLSTVTKPSESEWINPDNSDVFSASNQSAFGGVCTPFADLKLIQGDEKEMFRKLKLLAFNNHDGSNRHTTQSSSSTSSTYSIQMFSSEERLIDMFNLPRISFENGNMVRLVDLTLPDNENGIFDLLEEKHGIQALDLFNQVKNTIGNNYGRLIPRCIEFLLKQDKIKIKTFIEDQEWMFLANECNNLQIKDRNMATEDMGVYEYFVLLADTARLSYDNQIITKLYHNTIKRLFGVAVINMMQPQTEIVVEVDAFVDFVNDANNFPLITKGVKVSQSKVPNGLGGKTNITNIFTYIMQY